MSNIHYFQRNSQKENVATNNTLLLFSRLYNESPLKFEAFFSDLLNDTDFTAGIQFSQQTRSSNGSSIPDGSIDQSSFKIVVETKLYDSFTSGQLVSHLDAFNGEQYQVLLALGPHPLPPHQEKEVKDQIKRDNRSVRLVNTTFRKVIDKFRAMLVEFELELHYLIDDYEEFCAQSRLLPDDQFLMRAVGCGWTLEENFDYNLYYDSKGYSPHRYIGMYTQKCIVAIGQIENTIQANLEGDQLIIVTKTAPVTEDQKQRIISVIAEAQTNNGWDITSNHTFFCVKKFHETNFKKESLYPLQGTKFFNLKEVLDLEVLPVVEELAELLKKKEW